MRLSVVFLSFGVPEEISSDGGPEFVSAEAKEFYDRWGVTHRLSSAYFPQSNGRAEVAVKLTKRLLEDNVGVNGTLDTDKVVRALLQQRNTPDKDCNLSPAQIIFGRPLRDSMPQLDKSIPIFESAQLHNQWHQAWSAKEEAIRSRLVRSCEGLENGSRELPPLREGDSVFIQNQGKSPGRRNKWDRQGRIVAIKDHDQHLVKVDGSGRLTLRNRRFLRKFQLRSEVMMRDGEADRWGAPDSASSPVLSAPLDNSLSSSPGAAPSIAARGTSSGATSGAPDAALKRVPEVPTSDVPNDVPSTAASTVPRIASGVAPGVVPSVAPNGAPSASSRELPGAGSCQEPCYPLHGENNSFPTGCSVRRSSRQQTQRSVYDAATGTYVAPSSLPIDNQV